MQNFIFATDYSWYGMANLYNSMRLLTDFSAKEKNGTNYTMSQYYVDTAAMYNWTESELWDFLTAMRQHVTHNLWGGLTKTYTIGDLVQGFKTDLAAKINTGPLSDGNLYVDDTVTPVINWWMGPASDHSYTMMTGGTDNRTNQAGQIYNMDGNENSWIYLRNNLYTSSGWVEVPWYNEANLVP